MRYETYTRFHSPESKDELADHESLDAAIRYAQKKEGEKDVRFVEVWDQVGLVDVDLVV